MSGVDEILERLEAASEGSRKLDYAIKHWLETNTDDEYWKLRVAADWTTSIDAALALAERVLPGWGFFLRKDKDGCNCGLVYPEASFVTPGCGTSPTPALALCIAILRARQAAEAVRQDDGGR